MAWLNSLFTLPDLKTTVISALGIAVSSLVGLLYKEYIYMLLARAMNWLGIKNKRGLNGLWNGVYLYHSGGKLVEEYHVLQLRQIGNYVVGHDIESKAHWNRLLGRLEDNAFLTGTWRNQKEGQRYFGAVQLVLSNEGDTLNGQYIGFDSENKVRNGPWQLHLLDRKISTEAKQMALNKKASFRTPLQWTDLQPTSTQDFRPVFHGLIQTYSEAWTKKDPKQILTVFSPDAQYHERVGEEPFKNHSGIEAYWNDKVVKTQEDIRFELKSLHAMGPVGVAEWEAEFNRLDTRERIHIWEIALMKLKDNKIHEFREYWRSKKVSSLDAVSPLR